METHTGLLLIERSLPASLVAEPGLVGIAHMWNSPARPWRTGAVVPGRAWWVPLPSMGRLQ